MVFPRLLNRPDHVTYLVLTGRDIALAQPVLDKRGSRMLPENKPPPVANLLGVQTLICQGAIEYRGYVDTGFVREGVRTDPWLVRRHWYLRGLEHEQDWIGFRIRSKGRMEFVSLPATEV